MGGKIIEKELSEEELRKILRLGGSEDRREIKDPIVPWQYGALMDISMRYISIGLIIPSLLKSDEELNKLLEYVRKIGAKIEKKKLFGKEIIKIKFEGQRHYIEIVQREGAMIRKYYEVHPAVEI